MVGWRWNKLDGESVDRRCFDARGVRLRRERGVTKRWEYDRAIGDGVVFWEELEVELMSVVWL